jgi:hypothetical protein
MHRNDILGLAIFLMLIGGLLSALAQREDIGALLCLGILAIGLEIHSSGVPPR